MNRPISIAAALALTGAAGCSSLLGLDDFSERPQDGAGTDAAPHDASGLDGCDPLSDMELCATEQVECGALETTDPCGGQRVLDCGTCEASAQCVLGACVTGSFAWQTGAWSSCSVSCGGGTQTRSVWCEQTGGTKVDDALCPSPAPAKSRQCNTQPCCTPSCAPHDACGDDGCGVSCGTCDYDPDRFCQNGYCVWQHGNNGTETCSTICGWGTSQCVGTSVGTCADKLDTVCFCW